MYFVSNYSEGKIYVLICFSSFDIVLAQSGIEKHWPSREDVVGESGVGSLISYKNLFYYVNFGLGTNMNILICWKYCCA